MLSGASAAAGTIKYGIDHGTALGPCSTCHMTPTSLLVCVETIIYVFLALYFPAKAASLFDNSRSTLLVVVVQLN